MTTLEKIAALCESMYYSGRVKVDKRFDRNDFLELARIANASIMRAMYFESKENGNDQYFYFQDCLEEKEFELSDKKDARGRKSITLDADILKLPANLGVFDVKPAAEEDCETRDFVRVPAGSEAIYADEAYDDMPYFITMGKNIHLYHCNDCLKNVEVTAIFNDNDIQIPEDVAKKIVEWVQAEALKSTQPIDKTNDNNPNPTPPQK